MVPAEHRTAPEPDGDSVLGKGLAGQELAVRTKGLG